MSRVGDIGRTPRSQTEDVVETLGDVAIDLGNILRKSFADFNLRCR